jgi:hypothetical protein
LAFFHGLKLVNQAAGFETGQLRYGFAEQTVNEQFQTAEIGNLGGKSACVIKLFVAGLMAIAVARPVTGSVVLMVTVGSVAVGTGRAIMSTRSRSNISSFALPRQLIINGLATGDECGSYLPVETIKVASQQRGFEFDFDVATGS